MKPAKRQRSERIGEEELFHPVRYRQLAQTAPMLIVRLPRLDFSKGKGRRTVMVGEAVALAKLNTMHPGKARAKFGAGISALVRDAVIENVYSSPVLAVVPVKNGDKIPEPFEKRHVVLTAGNLVTHGTVWLTKAQVNRTTKKAAKEAKTLPAKFTVQEHKRAAVIQAYKDAVARELWRIAKQNNSAV